MIIYERENLILCLSWSECSNSESIKLDLWASGGELSAAYVLDCTNITIGLHILEMFLLIHDIKEILIETHCFFLLTWKGNVLLLLLLSLCLYMHVFDKPYFSSSDGTTQSLGTCLRDFRNKPYPVRAKITYYQKTLSVGQSYIN